MYSPLEQFNVINVITIPIFGFIDLSFTNIVIPLIFAIFFIRLFVALFKDKVTLIPSGWQYFVESLYLFVFNILKVQAGANNGFWYFPFIFTLFVFILLTNLISLTPFGIALTSHLIMMLFLSLTIWSSIFLIGLITHQLDFLKIFIPESPFILLLLLIPIEIFSYGIRAFSLAIRLSANIMAGHTLVYIISSFILNMSYLSIWFFFIFVGILLAILLLEIGVAFLQAYVFTILTCIYFNDSLKQPGH
jgi:ATP synthase subunit 6